MADALISVAGVTVSPGVRSNTVRWTVNIASCLPYLQLAVFEVWSATTNNRASATKVGDATDLSFTHQGLLIGAARYYWVRAKDTSGQYSDFFPVSATSGVAGVPTSTGTNSVGSDELADNSVGGNHLKADSVTADKISVTNLAAISATLGDVAVNGSLVVSGTITASKYADGSVGTNKIAKNNVLQAYTSGGAGEIAANSSSTFKTLVTAADVVVPSNASGVLITAYASGEYGNPCTAEFRVLRNSTNVEEWDGNYVQGSGGSEPIRYGSSYAFVDSPSAGTYDYVLQVRSRSSSSGFTSYVPSRWKYRRIVAQVMKR